MTGRTARCLLLVLPPVLLITALAGLFWSASEIVARGGVIMQPDGEEGQWRILPIAMLGAIAMYAIDWFFYWLDRKAGEETQHDPRHSP